MACVSRDLPLFNMLKGSKFISFFLSKVLLIKLNYKDKIYNSVANIAFSKTEIQKRTRKLNQEKFNNKF